MGCSDSKPAQAQAKRADASAPAKAAEADPPAPAAAERSPPAPAAAPAPPPPAGGAPPPPPPPPSAEHFKKLAGNNSGGKDDSAARAALFADIAKGTDITKGLRKVDRSQMNHKNRDPNAEAKAVDFSELEKRKAARAAELEKKRAEAAGAVAKKEPSTKLEGKMWKVENHVGPSKFDRKHDKLEDVDMSQSVTISDCENYLLEITGKVNMVIIGDCKNVGVMMKDVVSGAEVSKGQKIEVQASGKLPSFIIDRCNELMLYTDESSRDVEITATASTCVNITFTNEKEGEDPVEKAIPEQFVTKIEVDAKGVPRLVTKPMEHAG